MKIGDVEIDDNDFAEAFPMWASRILITAENEKWALIAAKTATGFASSIIMSPAEAGVEGSIASPNETPDNRPGVYIQVYHRLGSALKLQLISRLGQCVLTCPTTAAFDAMPLAKKRLKVGRAIKLFGDGFEKSDTLAGRKIWRIPVMEGEFIIEDKFGVRKCVAGGNFLIMAENRKAALEAAEKAVEAIQKIEGVILPFPGGICRSGSKVGARKYKLPASTNHPYCPVLRGLIEDSKIPEGVNSVYEIVFNGVTTKIIKKATAAGIKAAVQVKGVKKISAVNFGGKLGPIQINLKEALESNP
ncbi:MAG: formylmethanofuran--tetrahydromethanopterin N-formyltransferase [Candidatus Bathyarchaeia archaeon]|nr:formylmethanofuran--tetrahydromethanopterin N-formyltransferase [Candidatus Bathyarchaeota archaeon]